MLNHKRLFRLARSAWKILILHSVQAKTKYRLKIRDGKDRNNIKLKNKSAEKRAGNIIFRDL